jgi:hypothetical protein
MALIKCPECQRQISDQASACPACGYSLAADKKRKRSRATALGWGVLLLGIFGLIGVAKYKTRNEPPSPAALCESDWRKCIDNKQLVNNYRGISQARSACKSAAEDRAKYETKFPWVNFGGFYTDGDDYKTGRLKLVEKDAEFQNSYGAMVRTTVECLYDLNQKKVVNVNTRERG